jgi:hypothetical protein
MQVLQPDVRTFTNYSNEDGHFIEAFGISTKRNGNNWAISKQTGHEKIKQFQDRDFAIIPQMLQGPTKGHYFGNDTEEDLINGYSKHSHGKIIKIKGPYNYNDGTDDYFYNFVIKLRDSKAAAVLNEYGPKTWIPFSISPHIMPLSGPDWEMDDWHAIGTALVDRGAYGPDAIITKFCTGSAPKCEKSLAAAALNRIQKAEMEHVRHLEETTIKPCEKADTESSRIITSLVSKVASFQASMAENIPNTVTNAPIPVAELKAEPSTTAPQTPVNQITITAEEIQKIKDEAIAKSEAIWKEKVTALETKDKINTLNLVWAKVKDPTVKEALVKKYQTLDNVDIVKEIAEDVIKNLSQQEEEDKDKEKPAGDEPPTTGKKSKAASLELTKEPDIPSTEEKKESKAASQQQLSHAETINRFIMEGKI